MIKRLILDIITFSTVFFGALFFIKGSSSINGLYLQLWAIILVIRSFAYFYYQKYMIPNIGFKSGIVLVVWSNALILFSTVFILSVTHFSLIPRTLVIQFILLPFFLDILTVLIQSKSSATNHLPVIPSFSDAKGSISVTDLFCWLASVFIAYHFVTYIKYQQVIYNIYTWDIISLIFLAWLISAIFTQKYNHRNSTGVYLIIGQHIKATIIVVTLLGVPHFFLRMEHLSRFLLYGTGIVSGLIDVLISTTRHLYSQSSKAHLKSMDEVIDELGNVKQQELPINHAFATYLTSKTKLLVLSNLVSAGNPFELKFFLEEAARESGADLSSISLLSTSTSETIDLQTHNSVLVNFHKCNDQRRLNKYLISCHNSLDDGGLLIGYFEPLSIVSANLRNRLPRLLFLILSPLHFLFHRIIPKIRLTSYIYFLLTRGKNRVLSKAEMFGRLSYCGFDILAEHPMADKTAFVAQKSKTISSELKPSFRAIVGLKRIGYKGEIIRIYKVRTMHPYSEFLQKYVYDNSKLDASGKFNNDFRLTSWGKILRKTWLDELPQLYNWVRGDIKLVGVRALSHQYFSIYPDELQQLRIKTKPGLVPPYYVDMPKEIDEIIASEIKYLDKYFSHPIRTDIEYFFKAFWNIAKGARSK